MDLIYLSLAVILTAVAQLFYKMYYIKKNTTFLSGSIMFFCTVPVMNYMALQKLSLSTVYMATGLTHALVVLMAYYFLEEVIDNRKKYAVLLIISGIVIFNW